MVETSRHKHIKMIMQIFIYIFCIFLALMCVIPFIIMVVNGTRSTVEIQQQAVTLLPSVHIMDNIQYMSLGVFNAWIGFKNSMIVSVGATACAVYFSSLTAYALMAYDWRLRQPFFTFILAVMMIPAQVSAIGFYQFVFRIGLTNSLLPFIIPAIASPTIVFFMRQYLLATFSIDIVNSARIDGAKELYTFNRIVLPMMKPAMAMQAIFVFVSSWNNLFMPLVLLTDYNKFTMPVMVSQLRGNIYRTELGAIYLGLTLSVLPLFIVYFSLSRYIIAGVQLGGIKE
ncbi:MAG: carbohydrate ABC transporter permease [Lachnospiraceae bacterium]|nr:carbohydrate ABC transporter permease [Lachnospiraceae bacterium]